MIKTILVPSNGDEADFVVFDAALSVARAFEAHLTVLHVRPDATEIALSAASDALGGTVVIEGLIEQLEREVHEREARAKSIFDEFSSRAGLALAEAPGPGKAQGATAQWLVETGGEARSFAAHGMAADLIVAGRSTNNHLTTRSVLEAALLDTGRPLLVPGPVITPALLGGTIAIAWKPTPQAARTVAAAMPFLRRATDIVAVTVEEAGASEGSDRLIRYLAWHGCAATAEILSIQGGDPVGTLVGAAQERAGLLVMGGYGHSRLREWIFGGFTERVLADAPLPVLMAH
jgi:nucleotide-binding universal stress UspA family protein